MIELIQTAIGLESISAEWGEFVRAQAGSTPFHLPEWLLTWWRHFGSGALHVLVFRDSGRIRALLSCFLHEWEGRKQLTLVGAGITDYLDPLIEPGFEPEFVEGVRQYLDGMPEWQAVEWTDLSPSHPLFDMKGVLQKPGLPCAEIPFAGSFEEFWSRRGKELRRNLRRYRDRAQQISPIQFEIHREGTPELIETLIRLHTKRWVSQGEPGMVEANQSAAFLKEVTERMSNAGVARFFALRFKGAVAALILAFPYKQKIFAYMSAFDPEFAALGLGRTLLYEALRSSYGEYLAWNFLRGDEPYKAEWGAEFQARARLRLERPAEP
jgi:CelD/BcsL family acetyltransferase involved in cellulose biosynthesis